MWFQFQVDLDFCNQQNHRLSFFLHLLTKNLQVFVSFSLNQSFLFFFSWFFFFFFLVCESDCEKNVPISVSDSNEKSSSVA